MNHFNRQPLRDAGVINVPNVLKAKVGSGGLSEAILDRAQLLIDQNAVDFVPLAGKYLQLLQEAIDGGRKALKSANQEDLIYAIIYPVMQLKANGGMFHYPLVTDISHQFVQFLEVIREMDEDVLQIVMAFYNTLQIILRQRLKGTGSEQGQALKKELIKACERYFQKSKLEQTPA